MKIIFSIYITYVIIYKRELDKTKLEQRFFEVSKESLSVLAIGMA